MLTGRYTGKGKDKMESTIKTQSWFDKATEKAVAKHAELLTKASQLTAAVADTRAKLRQARKGKEAAALAETARALSWDAGIARQDAAVYARDEVVKTISDCSRALDVRDQAELTAAKERQVSEIRRLGMVDHGGRAEPNAIVRSNPSGEVRSIRNTIAERRLWGETFSSFINDVKAEADAAGRALDELAVRM
jgi:hypothetical protein